MKLIVSMYMNTEWSNFEAWAFTRPDIAQRSEAVKSSQRKNLEER